MIDPTLVRKVKQLVEHAGRRAQVLDPDAARKANTVELRSIFNSMPNARGGDPLAGIIVDERRVTGLYGKPAKASTHRRARSTSRSGNRRPSAPPCICVKRASPA